MTNDDAVFETIDRMRELCKRISRDETLGAAARRRAEKILRGITLLEAHMGWYSDREAAASMPGEVT